jgi:hypothetical protein
MVWGKAKIKDLFQQAQLWAAENSKFKMKLSENFKKNQFQLYKKRRNRMVLM